VIEALVAVCSDPDEPSPVWTEAAEALGYIWSDDGPPDPVLLQRLTTQARSSIIHHLTAVQFAHAKGSTVAGPWGRFLDEMIDDDLRRLHRIALLHERHSLGAELNREIHGYTEREIQKRGLQPLEP